jgi:cell division protein FtsQ
MALYQGRALRTEAARRAPRGGLARVRRVLIALGTLVALGLLVQFPWSALGRHWLKVSEVRVEGLRYLDPERVIAHSGLHRGDELFGVDLVRARQALLMEPRIASATVSHRWPFGLQLVLEERVPVLLVQHGVPWELDSAGVLLAPLEEGVVADVPLLLGPRLESLPAGSQVRTLDVQRGLAWVRALSQRELQLTGQVSEVDVSEPDVTALTLMSGTRVITPAWPPGTRTLSALRVVLADLHQRGTLAQEVDMRFENQVIVRPVEPAAEPSAPPARNS